jgi:sugar/nucleoside kinase (ribokinase family)
VRLTTIGDLLLDVVVRVDGPLAPGDDRTATTLAAPGGQAANVAAWAAALGASARFVGRLGDDDAGELVGKGLRAKGVDVVGPVAGRTGVVVSIAADGDRTMASDRGTAPELSPHDLDEAWFDCEVLHVSGYALLREPIASASLAAARLARGHGARISLDVSSSSLVDSRFRALAQELAPELTFATEAEQAAVGALATDWVLKRGARGLSAGGHDYPALPVEVVDTTGAGDALAAGFLVGGPELGVEAAARCCSRAGAMP